MTHFTGNDHWVTGSNVNRRSIGTCGALIIAAFVAFMALTGCTVSNNSENENAEDMEHTPLKFGATYMTMNNPYFESLDDSIEEVVVANGDVLLTRDPAQDQNKQNEQIQEMLDEGVAAIFLNPVDWKAVKPALIKCKEAGVPVFDVDTYVYDREYVVSSILSDNYNAGVQIAHDMMKKRSSARIAIINHENINSTSLRVQGFLDTIQGNPRYRVVVHEKITAELEVAMEITKTIIDDGIRFDVVLGGNDPTALGVLAALQLRRVEDPILIYGIDGSPDGKTMIKQGFLEGTSAQFPIEIGNTAAETAYRYLRGESVESNIIIPVKLITQENLVDYDMAGWQ
ncbi:MAG: sugar ABC transporter substrate-binding protein [Lachnospiraceae bacterium]|nr:sugar ABC transporter substrate-binding protein [Lachnospiraceae bacterium]